MGLNMISLMTTGLFSAGAFDAPGVSEIWRRKVVAPSGVRPIETPFCWPSKATASMTRFRFEFTSTMRSPVELSEKPSCVWFHTRKPPALMVVPSAMRNLFVVRLSLSQKPERFTTVLP